MRAKLRDDSSPWGDLGIDEAVDRHIFSFGRAVNYNPSLMLPIYISLSETITTKHLSPSANCLGHFQHWFSTGIQILSSTNNYHSLTKGSSRFDYLDLQ